jgi:hypothetical protein
VVLATALTKRRSRRAAEGLLAVVLGLVGAVSGVTPAFADSPPAVGGSPAVAPAWTDFAAAGEHSLAIVPVYWTAPDAQTPTTLRALARQTGDYWSEQTGGAVTIPDAKITVFNWLRIPDPGTCSDKDALFYAARDAANAASGTHIDAGAYHQHLLVYFPQTSACPWDGSASVGDEGNIFNKTYGRIWINGYTSGDVWEREFGHNLSLGHANTETCRDGGGVQVPLSATCDTHDYGDYDLMGQGRGHDGFTLNTALADRIGLLAPTAVRTASMGATFTLSPVSTHTGLLAVKVPLPDSVLYIEYRPSTGRDAAQPPGWSGVQVRQRYSEYFSRVLALSPDGADGPMANVAARVGAGWRIPGTYLTLVVDSQDASGASIRFVAPPDSTAPPAPAAPTAGGTATVSGTAEQDGIIGGDLFADWPRVDDPESGIASFGVYVDDVLVQTVSGTSFGTYLPALPGGVHRVRIDATNNVGMTTAGSERSFHSEPGPPAPAAPTVTPAISGASLHGELALDWTEAPDATLTGFQILVDEASVGTAAADVTHYSLAALAPGYHSARVIAVDALGLGVTSAATAFWVDPPPAPTMVASLSGVPGTGGWWQAATLRFVCSSADDTLVCPADLRLPSGANQQVTQSVTDRWQQTGWAHVHGVYVDGAAPSLTVTGVKNRAVYTRGVPKAGCTAADATSGLLRACTVALSAPKNRVVTFTASATDRAGNRATVVGTYTVWPTVAVMNASTGGGRYAVRAGGRYTITVNQASARSPRVYAPSASTKPQGRPLAVHKGTGGNWTVTVTVTTSLQRYHYAYVAVIDGDGVTRTLRLYVR